MSDLAVDLDEHRPARLVGVPVRLATQLQAERPIQRREQRGERVQAASQRARRHVQSMIGQIPQQAMTRAAVEKLVQQHAGPHRDAELAAFDQPRRRGRRHDPGHAAARAARSIAPSADHAPVGLDLDLEHLAVLGAGEQVQSEAALRTPWLVDLDELAALGQVRQHRATVPGGAATLPSAQMSARCPALALAGALGALALAAEHALLEITDLGVRKLQLADQRRLAPGAVLLEPIEEAAGSAARDQPGEPPRA
jgi:hypothetical protein